MAETVPLRLLVIEDSRADFLLLQRHLRSQGLQAECTQVMSAPELEQALANGSWDALLSDFNVPGMDIEAALTQLALRLPKLPLILVSGSVGEEKAVELLKSGVWDFVLKDSLGRLAPSLRRALREASDRRALELEQRRQRHLLEHIGSGILLVDAAGSIFMTNPALERMFGYAPGELLGQPVEVLVCEEDREKHVRERLDYMRQPAPRQVWLRRRIEGRRKDGSRFPIEIALNPYQEGEEAFVQATINDESELAQTERALRIAATVFEVQDGVMVTDRHNRILRVNQAFTEITGYAEEEVVGRDPAILKSGLQGPEFYREMWQTLERDRRWQGELQDRRKDGTIYPKWLTITALTDADGDVANYVGVFSDLTREKNAERALAASAAKSEFLANMSHEIRTPMTGVVGMAGLLQETALTREQRRMVKTIRESALSLLGILDDILDFSKIEAGKLALEQVPTCPHEVAEAVVRLLMPNAQARNVGLHVLVSPELPLWVVSDPLRLRQIMFNLLGNAIKFTQSEAERMGQVELRLESVARNGGSALQITVTDNGVGIPPEMQGQLFQPFTQADGSTTRRFGGTGLGLSITKRLVDMMHGSIAFHSTPGVRTQFTVSLPMTLALPGHVLPGWVDLRGARLLLLVGDTFYAEAATRYLRSAGAEVAVVQDVAEAGRLVREREDWALLVLDSAVTDAAATDARLAALPWLKLGRRGSLYTGDRRRFLVHTAPMFFHELLQAAAIASGAESVAEVVSGSERRQGAPRVPPNREQAAAAGTLVLLAEDNDINREVIQQQLHLLGYACDAVEDGAAALACWRSGRYALLLTDCHMPKLDGFQLTAAIRAEETAGRRLPIVAVTANAMQGEAERCLGAGMDGYLPKPVRLDELGAMLARWLPQDEAAAGPAVPEHSEASEDAAPVWDEAALTRLVGEQPALHRRLLDKFISNAREQVLQIQTALTAGDSLQAGSVAHKLKSAARSVGAMRLGQACQDIEEAARAGRLARRGSDAGRADRELDAFIAHMESRRQV